ncbi:MAG: cupin domain-containing protein [Synergistales bacterium]|nr:cupin domain-containing protein [Synergistales bacterium]
MKAFQKLDLGDMEEKELRPGLHVRFVHSDNATLAYWRIEEGASLPAHSHPHEQIVNVLSGELALTVDGSEHRLKEGGVVVVPGDVEHAAQAVEECRVLDVFTPVREDYR